MTVHVNFSFIFYVCIIQRKYSKSNRWNLFVIHEKNLLFLSLLITSLFLNTVHIIVRLRIFAFGPAKQTWPRGENAVATDILYSGDLRTDRNASRVRVRLFFAIVY